MVKVLGICCSPRLHGNTEILLQESLAKAQEAGADVELVTLAGKTISPCDGCTSCRKTGECHIKDDLQDIYPQLLEADGIIFGTPVYMGTVCAQAKILMDRTYVLLEARKLRNKTAGLVVTARRVETTSAFAVFSIFFNAHRMIMVGLAVGFSGTEKGKLKDHESAMAEAGALGRATVRRIQSYSIPS